MKILSLFFIACLSFVITACGFQLRGQSNIAQTIHAVSIDTHSSISVSLRQAFERQLNIYNIKIDPTAKYKLTIDELKTSKRNVATSRTSFNDRFLLRYTLSATLKKAESEWPLTTYSERVFSDERNTPSAKSREEKSIQQELQAKVIEDLAGQIRSFSVQ